MAVDLDFERTIYSHVRPVPAEDDLFTSFADRVLRRAEEVIDGRNCPWPPLPSERALLVTLRLHQGKAAALALGAIAERMHLTPRVVKDIVQDLRMRFGVQVGASRESDGGGYYLVATEEESEESIAQLEKQAITMLRVVRAMRRDRQSIDQMLHQLKLALMFEEAR
jgi:hypothetical protein